MSRGMPPFCELWRGAGETAPLEKRKQPFQRSIHCFFFFALLSMRDPFSSCIFTSNLMLKALQPHTVEGVVVDLLLDCTYSPVFCIAENYFIEFWEDCELIGEGDENRISLRKTTVEKGRG